MDEVFRLESTVTEPRHRDGWNIACLLLAAMTIAAAGCTYSGGKTQANSKYQASTADSYTYEFERRTPPGGD